MPRPAPDSSSGMPGTQPPESPRPGRYATPARSTRVDRPSGRSVRSFRSRIGFTGDMGYVIDPAASTPHEVRRVAQERLGDAIDRLDEVIAGADVDVEDAIHDVRKRCKETRGLARLVRPSLGRDFRKVDRLVRGAANELSATRDAHALLATFDTLLAASSTHSDGTLARLRSVRDHQATLSAEATASIGDDDERVLAARTLLGEARDRSQEWQVSDRWAPLGDGLAATYADGRHWFRTAFDQPTDRRMHEWRKSVKYLWYQTRLLRNVAPTVIDPQIEQLDALAEALGDDHDLAVLVAQLDVEPSRFGSNDAVEDARRLAREQQDVLRDAAFRAGATIYVESPDAFRRRMRGYWRLAVRWGPERPIGGIAALAEATTLADTTAADQRGSGGTSRPAHDDRARTKVPRRGDPTGSRPVRSGRDPPGVPRHRHEVIRSRPRLRSRGLHADVQGRQRRRAHGAGVADRPRRLRCRLAAHGRQADRQDPPPDPRRRPGDRTRRVQRSTGRARPRRGRVRVDRGARGVRGARVVRRRGHRRQSVHQRRPRPRRSSRQR